MKEQLTLDNIEQQENLYYLIVFHLPYKHVFFLQLFLFHINLYSYLEGDLEGAEQDENFVSYAEKIKPEDEKLDLSKPTKLFLNWIRGLSEEPGGYLYLNNFKFKIFQAHQISEEVHHEVGYLTLGKRAILQLSDGEIELDEVQLEGKQMMAGGAFLNGARLTFPCFLK